MGHQLIAEKLLEEMVRQEMRHAAYRMARCTEGSICRSLEVAPPQLLPRKHGTLARSSPLVPGAFVPTAARHPIGADGVTFAPSKMIPSTKILEMARDEPRHLLE